MLEYNSPTNTLQDAGADRYNFNTQISPFRRDPAPSSSCRPGVVFAVRNYGLPNATEGRKLARDELPFMFKAFEVGQKPPPRPGTKRAEVPRAATIHEYLDWTVTASEPEDPDELVSNEITSCVFCPEYINLQLHVGPRAAVTARAGPEARMLHFSELLV